MSEPANNFDVLKEMGKRNLHVHLAPLGTNFLRARKVKAGWQVTIGVDEAVGFGLAQNRYIGGLILADKEEFERVKQELAGGTSPKPLGTSAGRQIVQPKRKKS